jgi:hypothetical protein
MHFKVLSVILGILVVALTFAVWKLMKSPAPEVEFFFTQTASEGTLIPEGNGSNVFHLTMMNVPMKVNFISNAPEKYFGFVQIRKFVELWKQDFAKEAPNSSLVIYDQSMQSHIYDFQLIDAKYNPGDQSVVYTTRLLSPVPPVQSFKEAALFIDSLDVKLNFINQSEDSNNSELVIFQK